MKAIIIEDIQKNYESLRAEIECSCPHVKIISWAQNCRDAIQQCAELKPDLLFLDIELPDGKGFNILRQIKPLKPAIIFVTGYDEHMRHAFEFSAIDYLMKPVDTNELVEAVARAEERNRIHLMAEQYTIFEQSKSGSDTRIALANQEVMIFKRLDEIVFLQANNHKTQFHFKDYFIEVNKNVGEYEDLFRKYDDFLVKTHRSYIVNLHEVMHFVRTDWELFMSNGKTTPLGEHFKQEVLGKLRAQCEEDTPSRPRIELADQRIIAYPYLSEVLYLEAAGNMTLFYLKDYKRTFVVSKNIGEFAKLLKHRISLMQVHRSHIINLAEVRYFNRELSSAIMTNGESIAVAEQNRAEFLSRLGKIG